MIRVQKFAILSEAVCWIILTLVIVVIGFPVGVVLVLAGGFFGLFHINFITNAAEYVLQHLTSSIQFITRKIQALSRRAEELKAQ